MYPYPIGRGSSGGLTLGNTFVGQSLLLFGRSYDICNIDTLIGTFIGVGGLQI